MTILGPRLAMPERHRSCDEYLARVREAARVLVASGYLLEEDVDTSLTFAGKLWDMWA